MSCVCRIATISSSVRTLKSLVAVGPIWWRTRRSPRIACATGATKSGEAADTEMFRR